MKVWNEVAQGSQEWLELRVGKITASRYKDARDFNAPTAAEKKEGKTRGKPSAKCIAYAAQVAVERIAECQIERVFENWQMREGKEQEPHARNAYDVETGHVVQEVGAITTDDDLFLYSPDGLIGDDGLLEIKTLLSADVICKVIGDCDLSAYVDQCMGGLWLTGRQWIDLVLWAPALAPIGRQLTIHRITRDENAIEALETDLVAFARMVSDAEAKLRSSPKELAAAVAEIEEAEAAQRKQSDHDRINDEGAARLLADAGKVAATANVHQMPVRPAAATPPTLKLGTICERLGFTVTADFLASLGFPMVAQEKSSKLWRESDFPGICSAIAQHVVAVANAREAA